MRVIPLRKLWPFSEIYYIIALLNTTSRAMVLTPGPGEPQGVLGSSLLVLESRRACWGPHSWSWRAAGRAGVLTSGPGEPQGVLGSSLLVLESRRVCWGPHSWSWRAAGRAGVLTPGPGESQGALGSSLLVLESRRVCWGPHSWSWTLRTTAIDPPCKTSVSTFWKFASGAFNLF